MSAKLDWLKAADTEYYNSLPVQVEDKENPGALKQVCTFGEIPFDFIIGSDIVYWTSSIKPLMDVLTVSLTFSHYFLYSE